MSIDLSDPSTLVSAIIFGFGLQLWLNWLTRHMEIAEDDPDRARIRLSRLGKAALRVAATTFSMALFFFLFGSSFINYRYLHDPLTGTALAFATLASILGWMPNNRPIRFLFVVTATVMMALFAVSSFISGDYILVLSYLIFTFALIMILLRRLQTLRIGSLMTVVGTGVAAIQFLVQGITYILSRQIIAAVIYIAIGVAVITVSYFLWNKIRQLDDEIKQSRAKMRVEIQQMITLLQERQKDVQEFLREVNELSELEVIEAHRELKQIFLDRDQENARIAERINALRQANSYGHPLSIDTAAELNDVIKEFESQQHELALRRKEMAQLIGARYQTVENTKSKLNEMLHEISRHIQEAEMRLKEYTD